MKRKNRRRLSEGVWTAVGLLMFLLMMFPVIWMVCASLMTETQIFHSPPYLFPPTPSFEAYRTMLGADTLDFGSLFKNSMIISGSTMVLGVLLSVPAAYGIAKFRIRGKKVILLVFLISQMLPSVFNLIPYFMIFKEMGISNTYLAPIIADATMAVPFSVIMLRPYFLSIPEELAEAARIDGCGHLRSFVKVMMPICTPGIAVAFVFSFLFAYGDMIYSKTLLGDTSMWPVTTGIYNTIGRYGIQWSNAMAFSVLVILPVIVVFVLMQRYIVDGLVSGAVKG